MQFIRGDSPQSCFGDAVMFKKFFAHVTFATLTGLVIAATAAGCSSGDGDSGSGGSSTLTGRGSCTSDVIDQFGTYCFAWSASGNSTICNNLVDAYPDCAACIVDDSTYDVPVISKNNYISVAACEAIEFGNPNCAPLIQSLFDCYSAHSSSCSDISSSACQNYCGNLQQALSASCQDTINAMAKILPSDQAFIACRGDGSPQSNFATVATTFCGH
jgi:hypothetical protein